MLQVLVKNNIRIRGASVPLKSVVTGLLTIDNPAYLEMKKRKGRNVYGLDPKLQLYQYDQGDLVVPRGFLEELRGTLKQQGTNPDLVISYDLNAFKAVDFGPWNENYMPREYQIPAIEAATTKGGTLVAPAGSGKTLMGFKTIHNWQQPALWLTHTLELMNQSAEAARKFMPGVGKIGMLGDGKIVWGDGKLFIATVQTLSQNATLRNTLNGLIGALVIDEAHHFPAVQFVETVGQFNPTYILGVTATPKRKDFLETYLFRGVGPICYEVPREALHDAGNLIMPEVRFVYTSYNRPIDELAENSVDAGGEDIQYTQLIQELIQDDDRAQLVAENILQSCLEAAPEGGGVIVLGDSIRYLFKVQEKVLQLSESMHLIPPRTAVVHGGLQRYSWVKANAVPHGDAIDHRFNKRLNRYEEKVQNYTLEEWQAWQVTSAQRDGIMQRAYGKQIDILFATGALAREGLDMPHLSRGHLITPARGDSRTSTNGASVEQAIGRIQRPDPNNKDKKAVWYDYVDFEVGVFQDQYYSRRKVYKRLGIPLPKKKKSQRDRVEEFLKGDFLNFGSLPPL